MEKAFRSAAGADDDAQLLHRVARGDRSAFALLYDRFSTPLYSLALRMLARENEARELLGESFLSIRNKAETFRAARGSAFSWMVFQLRTHAVERLRSRRSEVDRTNGSESGMADLAAPFPTRDGNEYARAVRSALADLSDEQRQVVRMAFFEGLTQAEIAQKMEEPLGTIKAWAHQGMVGLRRALKFQQGTAGSYIYFEELAALEALGLLDQAREREMLQAIELHPEFEETLHDFNEAAVALVYEGASIEPPPGLKSEILHRLPAPTATSRLIRFVPWLPYSIAVCLMAMGIFQIRVVLNLQQQLASVWSEAATLKQSNALMGLRLVTLEAKDPAYASAEVIVAWDPNLRRGVFSVRHLPAPPAGHDYQLWVLDPKAETPISAGLVPIDGVSHAFTVGPVSTASPGFALSLEPAGGQVTPTLPILFAVAPEE